MNSQDFRNLQEAYLNVYDEDYTPWDFGPKQKAREKFDQLAQKKAEGNSVPGTATRANTIASVAKDMRTTLDKNSAATGTDPAKQGLQPATQRHTLAALRGAGGGMTASKMYDVKPLKPASRDPRTKNINASYEPDLFDVILEYLITEGYADTQEAALAIMRNMSEEWKDTIVEEVLDEAYVDYRKGKLPSGRTPQQSLNQGIDRNTKKPPSADAQDRNATAKQAKSVGKEMDAHTSFGGKIMKALTPGLGNRSGAAPRVVYGEPNTDRHQRARNRRGEPSIKD